MVRIENSRGTHFQKPSLVYANNPPSNVTLEYQQADDQCNKLGPFSIAGGPFPFGA